MALAARLPTLHGVREYVEAGGLMSYGPNWPIMWRRAADLVDKILRGTKPSDNAFDPKRTLALRLDLGLRKLIGWSRLTYINVSDAGSILRAAETEPK